MTALNSQTAFSKLFSTPSFKDKDPAELIKRFSVAPALRANNKKAKDPSGYQLQTESGIGVIPEEGVVIRTPGQYYLDQDISWTPKDTGAAILILCSDVMINMNDHTLTIQASPDTDQQYIGIGIGMLDGGKTIYNGIALLNGTIRGASYYGVNALQTTNLHLDNIHVAGMSYKETAQPDLTPCGIFIDKTEGFTISRCSVRQISVTAPSCAGIQIIGSCNGNVSGCVMEDFLNNDGGVQGFSYLESFDIVTEGCISQRFRSHYLGLTNTTGHTVIGYVPIMCFDLKFNNCKASEMTGCCDDCHGMSVFLDSYVEVNNFSAYKVLDGDCSANTGAKATGLEVYGDYITINDCRAEDIKAIVPQDLQSAGFSAWGSYIAFNNCNAWDVKVLDDNRHITDKHGYGTGFGWAPDPRGPQDGPYDFNCTPADHTQYNNCNSYDCQLGFDTWFHTNSVWNNVAAYNCKDFILVQLYGTPRTLSMDDCSESPSGKPESVTIYNIAEKNTYPGS